MLFYTGINTGLRIFDFLKLNCDDIRNKDKSTNVLDKFHLIKAVN